jgi:hypothetical protein
MNWWLISCVASAVLALTIGGVLIAFWFADKADDLADYERQVAHGDSPWGGVAERDRAYSHLVTDPTR